MKPTHPHHNEADQPIGPPVPSWTPCPALPKTPMHGRFCHLELLQPDKHAADLFNAFSHDTTHRNWTYLTYGPFATLADFNAWLTPLTSTDDPLFFAIIDKQHGNAIGMASYLNIVPAIGSIEVGHVHFSPLLQRTPLATEAMYLMMQRVFEELGYRRYEWKCDALNAPSQRAANRLGFSFEGIFRQATIYKGRNRDTAWLSLLDNEWPTQKAILEAWLAPANFTDDDQQLCSLRDILPASQP